MITNANAVKNVNTVPQNNNGWLKCDEMILQATTAGWALIDLNQQIVTLERQFMRKYYNQHWTSKTAKNTFMHCDVGCNSIHKSINNGFNQGFNWRFH